MGVVFFLGMAKIVNSSLSVGTDILNYSRKYPFSLVFIALLTASAILLNNWLIPLWGINGSACATLFSYAFYFVCLLWFINCKLKVSIFNIKHLHILILMLLLFGVGMAWDALLLPLLAPLRMPSLVVVLVNALLKTVVLTVACALVVRQMHISNDVDAALEKIFSLRRSRKE